MAIQEKVYGNVAIASITPSTNNKEWSWVKFSQEVKTVYEGASPESSKGLGLMSILAPTQREFIGERTCYENVRNDVLAAANLSVGSIVPGVDICDYRHEIPTKDGQPVRSDGKYHTSKIVPKGTILVVDVPLAESQAEYDRWKKATLESAASAVATTQAGSSPIAD